MCLQREEADEKAGRRTVDRGGGGGGWGAGDAKKDAREVKEEWEFRPKSIEQLMCIDLLPLLLLFGDRVTF